MSAFRERLLGGMPPLLLDGGLGTQLQERGLPPGVEPERFCLAHPEVLKSVHADYLKAGADAVLTGTFGGNAFKLPRDIAADMGAASFNRRMADIARQAVRESGRSAFVGGDIGPCGHFVKPLGDVEPMEMFAAFREQARGLAEGGVDFFIVETQFDLAEARIAVAAIRDVSDLPVFASMTFEQGVSLTGSTPEIFAATMRNMGVDAVGLNCGTGPEQMAPLIDRFLACAGIPVLAEPNAGLPELRDGVTSFPLQPEPFAEQVAAFVQRGVRVVGGCCGTTPRHIAALRRRLDGVEAVTAQPSGFAGISLSSRSSLVRIGGGEPLQFIGERINPTGRKAFQAELQAGSFSRALDLAAEQVAAGAPVLDVNVGAPMVDETALLPALLQELVGRHSTPFSLDSSRVEAIRAALPWHPGSALVNSISGEEGRMDELAPLCRQWGSPYILLPLQGRKLPVRAAERIAIIETLLRRAEDMGLPPRMALVDVLALAVASKPEAALEGLETIRWCAANGLTTVIGLSNISFGLPARELVNATFLAMAQGAGLNACIANPLSARMNEARAAGNVLTGRDLGASSFVAGYSDWTGGTAQALRASPGQEAKSASADVREAILLGDKEHIEALVRAELDGGADPFRMVNERMIPAITEVGDRYARREIFLPQLLRSAETMQAAFAVVKPLLEAKGGEGERPVVILATVEGDIHDIGKNIVGLLLGNHGFSVIDLGKDVKAADIVDAAVRHNASIIGLSALMTTTMVRMEDTVRLVRERNLDIRVMVGGAVVTAPFAEKIGADGFSEDAVEAVRLAKSWIK